MAKAFGRTVAREEHQEPVVIARALGDLLTADIERLLHALERALHRDVLQPLET